MPVSTYRLRRAAAGLVAMAVLAVSAALGTLGGPLPVRERPAPSRALVADGALYVVQPGDTYWSIANGWSRVGIADRWSTASSPPMAARPWESGSRFPGPEPGKIDLFRYRAYRGRHHWRYEEGGE